MKRSLGRQEAQMLAYLQMRRQRSVRTGGLIGPLRLSGIQERALFSRMSRGGLIARVRRGLYLIPPQLPLGGSWSPDEALALKTLLDDRQGRYQVCGPNAFNRYGFDEQVPTRVYAYNNRISGDRTVGAVGLTLIKVADDRLGDADATYSSRTRTLVDAVYDWARFNSLPRAYDWIRSDLASGLTPPEDLVRCALKYGDVGARRRLGALLERQGAAESLLRRLERSLTPSSSLIPWIPTLPKRGKRSLRWGVVWNDHA